MQEIDTFMQTERAQDGEADLNPNYQPKFLLVNDSYS